MTAPVGSGLSSEVVRGRAPAAQAAASVPSSTIAGDCASGSTQATVTSAEIPGAQIPWPSAGQAWWSVFVFGLTFMVGYLDRGVLTLLVEPIKRDLHLTDTELSLVIGFAFVVFYVLLGLPLARRIDTGSRRLILALCVTIWSICTALCGLAQNFIQLALCRFGMGAGDAATSPAVSSMISDLFPKERLPRAMSLLALAYIAGNSLSMLIGAAVIHSVSKPHTLHLPVLGDVFPWQLTFFIVGLPGLLVAFLYCFVPEPVRRGRLPGQGPVAAIPVAEVLGFMRSNWTVYLPMFLGLALHGMVVAGNQSWTPAVFSRNYGWSSAEFGSVAGTISLVLSPIGLLAGIRINESLFRRGYQDANVRLTATCQWLGLPTLALIPLMPTPQWALALFGWKALIEVAAIGSQAAALMVVTPNQMRGQVVAFYLFVFNVIGYGLGPTVVALFTDHVFGESQLRYAMATVVVLLGPAGALITTLGLRPYRRAFARAQSWD